MSKHFFVEKDKIYTFKDVDCKKDHQGPYLNHLDKKLTIAFKTPSLAAIVYAGAFERRVNLRSLHGHLQRIILGNPGADSGGEGKSKRAQK